MSKTKKKVELYTRNGCVDCKKVELIKSGDKIFGSVVFQKDLQIADIYRDIGSEHFIIIAKTEPEKMFLSCQPWEVIHSAAGIKAILDFVARDEDSLKGVVA